MQVAEITRIETAQRAALLRVDSYDVQLDLTGWGRGELPLDLGDRLRLRPARCGHLRRPDRRTGP